MLDNTTGRQTKSRSVNQLDSRRTAHVHRPTQGQWALTLNLGCHPPPQRRACVLQQPLRLRHCVARRMAVHSRRQLCTPHRVRELLAAATRASSTRQDTRRHALNMQKSKPRRTCVRRSSTCSYGQQTQARHGRREHNNRCRLGGLGRHRRVSSPLAGQHACSGPNV